jgi:hypothetical protein
MFFLVVWLSTLLALSITELQTVAFKMGKVKFLSTYAFVVLQLPLHLLVLFGSYALCNIGYNLMVLCKYSLLLLTIFIADCPDSHDELVKEIE